MDDAKIIELYLERSEKAIAKTWEKYGKSLFTLSYSILHDVETAKECENDTYLRTWNAIPPKHPENFFGFLCKITRNLSLNRLERISAQKRGGGEYELCLSEIEECVSSQNTVENETDGHLLIEILNSFLEKLPKTKRIVFVKRYFYMSPIALIGEEMNIKENSVKSILRRTREDLRRRLEKEGINL